mmetsp:Transcript_51759/g.102918  ORF Transcript_51759/g.102918 Transcript_51759/m.102918 type:complete len:246 (-) Transcript_51759:166-903(-)
MPIFPWQVRFFATSSVRVSQLKKVMPCAGNVFFHLYQRVRMQEQNAIPIISVAFPVCTSSTTHQIVGIIPCHQGLPHSITAFGHVAVRSVRPDLLHVARCVLKGACAIVVRTPTCPIARLQMELKHRRTSSQNTKCPGGHYGIAKVIAPNHYCNRLFQKHRVDLAVIRNFGKRNLHISFPDRQSVVNIHVHPPPLAPIPETDLVLAIFYQQARSCRHEEFLQRGWKFSEGRNGCKEGTISDGTLV